MKRYFYTEVDHLSDRGYNTAVEVYLLVPKGYPVFIGANYKLSSAAWRGYATEARRIIHAKCGHKLPDCYRDFPAKNVTLKSILGY